MGQAIKGSIHPLVWHRPSNDDLRILEKTTDLSIENHRRWILANNHLGMALSLFDEIGGGAYVSAGETQGALDISKRHLRRVLREGIDVSAVSETDLTPYWEQVLDAEVAAAKM